MFSKQTSQMLQSRMMSLKNHAFGAYQTGRRMFNGMSYAFDVAKKLHKATAPMLQDTPVGGAMQAAGKVLNSFENVRKQALSAGNFAEALSSKARRAAPEIF